MPVGQGCEWAGQVRGPSPPLPQCHYGSSALRHCLLTSACVLSPGMERKVSTLSISLFMCVCVCVCVCIRTCVRARACAKKGVGLEDTQ